jgi:hypothetical protein
LHNPVCHIFRVGPVAQDHPEIRQSADRIFDLLEGLNAGNGDSLVAHDADEFLRTQVFSTYQKYGTKHDYT